MENIKKIISLLEKSIKDDPNNLITVGGIIKDGYDEKVDEIRGFISTSQDWLVGYQNKLVEETKISNLKIKFTGVSGYFIEVPLSQKSKIPDFFVHKQTLVNAIRFITSELKEFESKLVEYESSLASLEYKIFGDIRNEVLSSFKDIKNISKKTAHIDMMTALSRVAYSNNYVKPIIKKEYGINILSGRHPVIEETVDEFITNNLELTKKDYIHIITGPNMGGKSTFLRQNALIVLMAHLGSYVPAKEASISIIDRIFSRVGASDNLYLGQSTFMVEMQEVANIINNSTSRSFIIIDEVGRGTSTYDGMSIAFAILRYIHSDIKSKCLFATHYHELVDESVSLTGVANYNVAVGESSDGIVFLRKVVKGGVKKSYGLEVAKLAGIKKSIIDDAKNILKKLEASHSKSPQLTISYDIPEIKQQVEIRKSSQIEEELEILDINNMSPMEALSKLDELKRKLKT